ncbi:LysR substrate-binding domain-containing protein [Vogesella sp. GCM10023246]|uniref:LysR substrate-binding domain-containing protein n=1 Tax=Vogesella oryzagri TaxID=3160864 RepID=A0ABV1LYR7_9NEIS
MVASICRRLVTAADGSELEYNGHSRRRVLDDAAGCISWGFAGGGLFQTYHFIAAPAVARGELVEVLPAYGGRSRQFSLIYPQHRHVSARVRAFVAFMRAQLPATAHDRR